MYDNLAVVVRYPQGLCKVLSSFVAERNRKVNVSNVNTHVVAYTYVAACDAEKIVEKIVDNKSYDDRGKCNRGISDLSKQ